MRYHQTLSATINSPVEINCNSPIEQLVRDSSGFYSLKSTGYDSNIIDNGNAVQHCSLTKENLSRFISSMDRMDSADSTSSSFKSDKLNNGSFTNSSSLVELKKMQRKSSDHSDNSDNISLDTVSSCGNFSYANDDEGKIIRIIGSGTTILNFHHVSDGLSSSSSYEFPVSPRKNLYPHGIINPNYPGFQHLAHTLSDYSDPNTLSYSDVDDEFFDRNNNENDCDEPEKLVDIKNNISNTKTYLENCKLVTNFNELDKCDEEKVLTKLSLSSTPPDILYEHAFGQEHQPDLIKNLTIEADTHVDDKPLVTNIVGDFGKEVEQEFGVIGYNFGIFRSFDMPSPTIYQKTTDALLSSAVDKAFEMKTKSVLHDERRPSTLTFNAQPLSEVEGADTMKKFVKHSSRPTKTHCETATNQAFCSAINNAVTSNGQNFMGVNSSKAIGKVYFSWFYYTRFHVQQTNGHAHLEMKVKSTRIIENVNYPHCIHIGF